MKNIFIKAEYCPSNSCLNLLVFDENDRGRSIQSSSTTQECYFCLEVSECENALKNVTSKFDVIIKETKTYGVLSNKTHLRVKSNNRQTCLF